MAGRLAVKPDGGTRSLEGRHPLRQDATQNASEDVPGTSGCKPGRQVRDDAGAAVTMGDNCVRSLENECCANAGGRRARRFKPVMKYCFI